MKARLYHAVPGWVPDGEVFHIRIRAESADLTQEPLAAALLASVGHYQTTGRWHCRLFLLMPDHLHALISFPRDPRHVRHDPRVEGLARAPAWRPLAIRLLRSPFAQ